MEETLFPLPPKEPRREGDPGRGRPRLKRPDRLQIAWRPSSLDELVAEDHLVRVIWDFVEQLDLSPLYARIAAVEGHPGQSAIDPKILMALWLYATSQGVGSARALERLCREHIAYLWILGGVTVNYHTLADFRTEHGPLLDRLLTDSVAALRAEGLVPLERTAQDGMRVRAHASPGSFQQRQGLEDHRREAEEQIRALKEELEADPGSGTRRQRAARERARRERQERVEKALQNLEELERGQRHSHKPIAKRKPPRASTTDPEARMMRMPEGGFAPAYNAQLSVDTDSGVVVGLDVVQTVDQGQMKPMVEQLERRYGRPPEEHLADGGFATVNDLEAVSPPRGKTVVYMPLPQSGPGTAQPWGRANPPEVIAAWRARMQTPEAQAIYRQRASSVEWVIAMLRNWGLRRVVVRGRQKVKAVLLWFVLLHNLLRWHALRLARGSAPPQLAALSA